MIPTPPVESGEARMYLHLYNTDKAKADFAVEIEIARLGIMTVRKLVHCGQIKKSENQSHSRSIANRQRSGRNLPGRGGGGLTMRLIDLTMPIWEGAGYGEILPFTNSSVRLLEYMFYDQHGLRMTRMKLDGETGSPLMVPHQRNPFDNTPLQPNPKFSWTLDDIPLEKLILRDTVILDIRAEEGHEITPAEME